MHMSKDGIYNQLISEADGFKEADAKYAVDNLKADYKKNALAKAKDYAKTQNMSNDAIYNQLTSSVEGFTEEQARYAVDNLDK
ncbi:surface lipoprotein-related protein [Staphylococcus aureus]|nr:surface lipoprotein-related protein [Staphylococcus aureus]SCT93003.1 surface lipoprotein-related protein [Staphylococcus aureus]